jgi:hypothetical protein
VAWCLLNACLEGALQIFVGQSLFLLSISDSCLANKNHHHSENLFSSINASMVSFYFFSRINVFQVYLG